MMPHTGTGSALYLKHQLQPGPGLMSLAKEVHPVSGPKREHRHSLRYLSCLYRVGTNLKMCNFSICAAPGQGPDNGNSVNKNKRHSPQTTAKPSAEGETLKPSNNNPTRRSPVNTRTERLNAILISDAVMKHMKKAKSENVTLDKATVRESAEMLPVILSTRPNKSHDILSKKTGSEKRLKRKTFPFYWRHWATFIREKVFISGPIPTLGRGPESFSRLLSLNTWPA